MHVSQPSVGARRAVTAAVLLGLCLPLGAGTAGAQTSATASESASAGAYFSSAGIAKPDASPLAPPNVTADADMVAPGNLAVAARANMDDKVSFLFFSLGDVPPDATVTKAVLTVPLVGNDADNVSTGQAPAKVVACKPSPAGFGGEDGAALSLAPERLCEEFSAGGKPSADGKSYVFDISGLAATWSVANDGVALTAAEGARSTPFQVVFAPADQATLAYSFTAPDEVTAPEPASQPDQTGTAAPPVFDAGSPTDGGFSSEPGLGLGLDTGSTVDIAPVQEPVVDAPVTEPEPVAAAPEAVVAAPLARTVRTASLRPSGEAWLGGLLLVALVALLSLVLGDPRVPVATGPQRNSRLAQALRARQQA